MIKKIKNMRLTKIKIHTIMYLNFYLKKKCSDKEEYTVS